VEAKMLTVIVVPAVIFMDHDDFPTVAVEEDLLAINNHPHGGRVRVVQPVGAQSVRDSTVEWAIVVGLTFGDQHDEDCQDHHDAAKYSGFLTHGFSPFVTFNQPRQK
jgi:hypothetical protein